MLRKKRRLGYGFSDEVAKVTLQSKHFHKKESIDEDWKHFLIPNYNPQALDQVEKGPWFTTIILVLIGSIFFVVFLRLFHLQITDGKLNGELADGNRIQIQVIHAPRGVIFDRNGEILAANSPAFRVFDKDTQKTKLISREQALELEVKNDPRAAKLEIDNVRTYPKGEMLTHLLGYVGQISQDQLVEMQAKGYNQTPYKSGDSIGQNGLEAQYESVLRGVDGGEIIEVDSTGKKIRTLRRNEPIPGKNIYLTVDAMLQQKAYQSLKETLEKNSLCCGSVVGMDPATGEILTLVSFPTFDPNIFTVKQDEQAINQVFTSKTSPLLNRVIAGTYPPGSTYKIVSSLAALASNKINPQTYFEDTGIMYLGPYQFSNWYFNQYGKTEGPVNLVKALQRSNDIYYYHVGQLVGEDGLIEWSKKLHLGTKLGIDLPGEGAGLVPDANWKQKTIGEPWYPGDTLHMAIGQGFVLTTPLQILGITSFIATNGVLYKPHLILKVTEKDQIISQTKSEIIVSNLAAKENIEVIKDGMKRVTQIGGTAWPFFTFPVATSGKTGTAEYGDLKGKTHAWYTSYAPSDDPKIVLTVLVESGGEGSSIASPIAKEVYRWFFSPNKNDLIKDTYLNATDSGKILGE